MTTGNAATVAAATLMAATDAAGTTPFRPPVQAAGSLRAPLGGGRGPRVDYGILANRNAAATSEGETTGSWARDLLRGLATLAALDPSQTVLGTDFTDIVATARDGLRSAVDALGEERGALGATEERLGAISQRHSDVTVTLTTQLASIQEVDMADTISQLNATKTQLEASYRAIAMVQSLSLTNFL